MTLPRQVVFWSAGLLLVILFFYIFYPILLPFVAGAGLAYVLDPLAHWFERRGFSRLWATIAILILFVLCFVIALIVIVPILVNQLSGLIGNIPQYVDHLQMMAAPLLDTRAAQLLGIDSQTIRNSLGSIVGQGAAWLTGFLAGLWSGGRALLDVLSLLLVTPVVAFYLLYDWDRMVARLDTWLPRPYAATIRQLGAEIGIAVSGFVRGQGLLCLILGGYYALGLVIIGLNFGLLIGVGAGFISFIPYVGSITGLFVALIVALVQFWPNWVWVAATAAVFLSGQFLEGNFLQPRLVGRRAGLHPVTALFALLAFGYLFGLVGLLVAVPTAAAIGVLVRFAVHKYLQSEYYNGAGTAPRPHDPVPKG